MDLRTNAGPAIARRAHAGNAGLLALLLLILGALALPGASASADEGERALDPRLSLIGGCSEKVEELDSVEDPGCPNTPPAGGHPPAGVFAFPRAVAVDSHGDVYVASRGGRLDGTEGRIDVFDPSGNFITEIPKGVVVAPQALAVDSKGFLYVSAEGTGELLRFEPCAPYDPAAGEIEYCEPPATVVAYGGGYTQMAIDPDDDHLFINFGGSVAEYSSAEEGNEELRTLDITAPGTGFGGGLALDGTRNRLYVQEREGISVWNVVEGLPPGEEYEKIETIDGSGVPEGGFGGYLSIAADEGTGHLFVYDTENTHLWELTEDGGYLSTIEFPFQATVGNEIALDNGLTSPNGKPSEEEGRGRYLYVPSHRTGTGHSFAFFVSHTGPPEVKSTATASVSDHEAELRAQINPGNLATTYSFELKAAGASAWIPVGEGTLAAGSLAVEASAAATGLAPGTSYRFRVVATNEEGSDEAEGGFATYPDLPFEPTPCGNALLRAGSSAFLPDCRAYELVTPPDTNGHVPLGAGAEGGGFSTRQVSPAGDKVPFRIVGGSLPGFDAAGGLIGDPYLATRTAAGWSTSLVGPTGSQTLAAAPGTASPDQGYSFWGAAGGPASVEGEHTFYVRYPDGHSELLGQGTLGIAPFSTGRLISEGGGHIVFTTGCGCRVQAVQLEPDAAPDGTPAVYDRTADGVTHVVSLKPGEVPFGAGEGATFVGASFDGKGVAFTAKGVLYLRYNDEQTFEVADEFGEGGVTYAGIAEGGGRVFYVEEGNLKAFDVASESTITVADAAAEVVPVTVSLDGSTAYFVSKAAILKAGANPEGAKPQSGGENLYRSREGQIAFLGTVTEADLASSEGEGLGLWTSAVGTPPSGLGMLAARSTPDGGVFLFKSRASLTAYDSEGHAEIYRYDSAADRLQCLSCNPTGAPAQSDASLKSQKDESGEALLGPVVWPENLRADGRRAFFQSSEALVPRDTDGHQDVYEWEDQGVGSCARPGGCLYLISSPHSSHDEYLWSVSASGDDVFFLSSDLLVGSDADGTPSIYDARVEGGFAEPQVAAECLGEACQPQVSPPAQPTPGLQGNGNVKQRHSSRRCGKGRRLASRHGKRRCVKRGRHHRRHHRPHHHRAAGKRKGAHR
jgi:hypothetical protein